MRLFQLFATTLFFTFIGIFAIVIVTAYSRKGGVTSMSMASVQKTRIDAGEAAVSR